MKGFSRHDKQSLGVSGPELQDQLQQLEALIKQLSSKLGLGSPFEGP